jgi:hypothetical protein
LSPVGHSNLAGRIIVGVSFGNVYHASAPVF